MFVATQYTVVDDRDVRIEARQFDTKGEVSSWVVKNCDEVLNKDGEWEYEPMPSSRTDDFLERTRFSNLEDARRAYEKYRKEQNDKLP